MFQCRAEFFGSLKTLVGILFERFQNDIFETLRQVGIEFRRWRGRRVDVVVQYLEFAARGERDIGGKQFVERDAEGVNIGTDVDALAFDLLGRHVENSAHLRAGASEVVGGRGYFGDTEIHDLDDARAIEHEIAGLDIAMDDAHAVGGADAEERLPEERDGFLRRDGAAAIDELLKRVAFDVLHDHDGIALVDEKGVERGDVGVVQVGLGAGFGAEALDDGGIAREVGVEDFDRDGAVEVGFEGAVDGAHAAFADLRLDQIVFNLRSDHLDTPFAIFQPACRRRIWTVMLSKPPRSLAIATSVRQAS
jgi:hypothetical protein